MVRRVFIKVLKGFIRKLEERNSFQKNWYEDQAYVNISDKKRKELAEKGFLAITAIAYNFEKYKEELFVTDKGNRLIHPLSKSTTMLIDNKAFIPCLFSWAQNLLPEVSIYLDKGEIVYCLGSKQHKTDLNKLLEFLVDEHIELFGKKVDSSGGKGAFLINKNNFKTVIPNLQSGKWLINNKLKNEKYSNDINDQSINTLRVVFFKNSEGDMKVFRILHRFGTKESGSVDNCSKGGMAFTVDLITGELGKGLISRGQEKNGWYSNHADTKKKLEGFKIPNWKEKLDTIQEIVKNLFYLNYGGLDLAPTDKGLKILEINSYPSIILTQMSEPALMDEEFSTFFKKAGYKP